MLGAIVEGTLRFVTPDPDQDTKAVRLLIKEMVETLKKKDTSQFSKTNIDIVHSYGASSYDQAVRICGECRL